MSSDNLPMDCGRISSLLEETASVSVVNMRRPMPPQLHMLMDLHLLHQVNHQQCHQSSTNQRLRMEPMEMDQPATAMLITSAQLDQLDQREFQELQDSMEFQDLTEFQESELKILLHNASLLDASLAHKDQLDHQELLGDQDHVDFQDQRDKTEIQEEMDNQDIQESKDLLDQLERLESQDNQERRDVMLNIQLEDQDQRDQREIKGHQDHQGKMDSTDHQESQELLDQKDQLESKDVKDQTVFQERLDRMEDQERMPSTATAQTELHHQRLSTETADTETSKVLLPLPNKAIEIKIHIEYRKHIRKNSFILLQIYQSKQSLILMKTFSSPLISSFFVISFSNSRILSVKVFGPEDVLDVDFDERILKFS